MFKDNTNALNEIFSAQVGYITKVYQKRYKKESDERLYVSLVVRPNGGLVNNVPYYGGGIDLDTGYPHGLFIPPRIKQVVLVLFLQGNYENPIGCIPLPFNIMKEDEKKYYKIMEDLDDISLFHFSGSRIVLRKNGKIELIKRVEKSTNNFENQVLSFLLTYEDQQSKKKIRDENNEFEISIDKENFIVKDKKDNKIQFKYKDSEEAIEIIDKNNNKIIMNKDGMVLEDVNGNKTEMKNDGINIEDVNGNKIVTSSTGVNINNGNHEVLL